MRILVLNAGSSSLKTSVIEAPGDVTRTAAELERPADEGWGEAIAAATGDAGPLDAVGHRVVHGGAHRAPLLLDDRNVAELEELRRLAPLHNGPALEVVADARRALPGLPQVACFDTAFHAALPEAARTYPLPFTWREEWGIRRYGFHGLSAAWSMERAATLLGRPAPELGLVVAHLGGGCSVTAIEHGTSVDTSMGMTPLEGLMMASRSGSIDPGILLELLGSSALTLHELSDALMHDSGLLGVSGVSADLREVQRAAEEGNGRAQLAIEMFVRRAAAGIAAAATALPRLDAVVFTGGIGENAAGIRASICGRLAQMGVPSVLSPASGTGDAVLSLPGARVAVLRVHAREDLVIARGVAALIA